MSLYRTVFAVALIGLLPSVAEAQMSDPTPPSTAAGACTIVGPLLGPTDFGVAAGLPLADTSAVLLPDGRVRMYMFAQGVGIVSAVSVGADGASFIPEAGARLPDGSGMPRAVALASGGWRLFYINGGGIQSAVSTDGLNFTVEDGFRITAEAAGVGSSTAGATSGATVVRLTDGSYRMYFSDLPRPGDAPGGHWIKSAVSTDQLSWTVEDGIRLGPGASVLTDSAEHPFALANPGGSVTLYYGKFTGPGSATTEGLYESTSADGLTFETETYDVFFGNDPDALRLTDGSLVVYYGQFDAAIGGTINLARCTDPGAGTATPTPTTGSGSRVTQILPGGSLSSASGQFSVTYQSDGNFVLYDVLAGTALWTTETGGTAPGQAVVQADGNFVIYDAAGNALWAAGTAGNPGAYLLLHDDGNFVIYNANAEPIWSRLTGSLLP